MWAKIEVDSMETPLLSSNDAEAHVHKPKFTGLVSTMKSNFFTDLPQKLRSHIDPEDPFDIDVSKAVGLKRAIAASTLDSLLDLMAGGILWFTHISMKNINIYKYPIGKLRVQPVGIIIFAAVMATLGFQVLLVAAEKLITNEPPETMSHDQLIWLYSIMLTATAIKLVLWIYCKSSRNHIVRAYAKDHYFDVVTNVLGLVAAVLGNAYYWWIDPSGAIVLAIYTIVNWSGTVMENAVSLIGQAAPPEVLQKLTYLVLRQGADDIKRVDTVRAYTFGVLYFVEVDIELPEDLPLKEAHAIGESLQIKLEELPEVERAFVHLDFECSHKPEHSVLSTIPNDL
ncbi:hypothetical protein Bca101_046115 [Brassica carinata]